jgi:tetrahydromethanopterin S-methyltransferase subunit C
MTMVYRIASFMSKISDIFPIGGGAVGAVTQSHNIAYLPTWEAVVSTIIISIIGALVGYLVKLVFDIIFHNIRKKYSA